MKIIKSIARGRSYRGLSLASSFAARAEDVVSGTNSYSGKFEDEEASMLLTDEGRIARFKKSAAEIAEDG